MPKQGLNQTISAKLTEEQVRQLDELAEFHNMPRGKLVRLLIETEYDLMVEMRGKRKSRWDKYR